MSLPGARRRCGRVWTHDNAPNLRGGHRGHPSMWSRHVTDERIVRCLADQVTVNLRAGVGRTDRRFVQRLGAPVRNAPWYDRQGEQERVQDRRGYPPELVVEASCDLGTQIGVQEHAEPYDDG